MWSVKFQLTKMEWKRICRVAGINYSVKTCLHNCVQKMNQRPAECMATTEVFSGRKMAMQRDVTNLQRTMISHILSLIMVLCVVHIFHLDIGCYSLLTNGDANHWIEPLVQPRRETRWWLSWTVCWITWPKIPPRRRAEKHVVHFKPDETHCMEILWIHMDSYVATGINIWGTRLTTTF